jgi:imidazolonepropionase-like amidohydrolase
MSKKLLPAIVLLFAAQETQAKQIPLSELAKPPPGAEQLTIISTAGRHGQSFRWITRDGVHMSRESMNLRGQIFELDGATRLGPDGMIDRTTIRGFTPQGDAGETFAVKDGKATWKSPVDRGSKAYAGPAEYASFGGPEDLMADLIESLIGAPGHSIALLPGGQAHAEPLTTLVVGQGALRQTITAYSITGYSNTPTPVWVDASGHFFAQDQGLTWIRAGYEGELTRLDKAQDDALAARSPIVARQLAKTPAGTIAFMHVRAFVDGTRFAEDETVIVEHGKITAVGPAAAIAVPAHAQMIDGHGKTLVPGLWDSHQHFGDDSDGPFLLSLGVTSARDPGNNNALTLARAARRARGDLLMPHIYPSVLIDGKGPYTAQLGSVATSQDEALAIVRKAKTEGFTGIKIYGSFNPAWVKATAAEAHRLGLHVHGHLPAGMRTMDAINDGYDEITHIYFVVMQAMPDSVVNVSNGIARMQGPAQLAKDVDLNTDPMKSLIATMAARKITSDPTLVVPESLMVPDTGDLGAAYAPYVGTLPPAVERSFRAGGLQVAPGYTREDYRASFRKLVALVAAMHRAGVPIVAGTDGSGMELVRELELYVSAGFTPAEALNSATLAAAHLVGADGHTGSIAIGKDADLVLVRGDPSRHIGDLRHTELVLMDGKMMDADALRAAGGFGGRPRFFE